MLYYCIPSTHSSVSSCHNRKYHWTSLVENMTNSQSSSLCFYKNKKFCAHIFPKIIQNTFKKAMASFIVFKKYLSNKHHSNKHHLYSMQNQEYKLRFTASEWARTADELTRERGLWGPLNPCYLDKWALDSVEGIKEFYRMQDFYTTVFS